MVAVAFVTSSSLGEGWGVGGAEIVGSGVGNVGGVGNTGGDGGVGSGSSGCGGVGNDVGSAGGVGGTMMNGVALGLGVGGGVDVGGAGTPAAVVVARTLASIVACAFGVFARIIVEVAVGSAIGASCVSVVGTGKPCPEDA